MRGNFSSKGKVAEMGQNESHWRVASVEGMVGGFAWMVVNLCRVRETHHKPSSMVHFYCLCGAWYLRLAVSPRPLAGHRPKVGRSGQGEGAIRQRRSWGRAGFRPVFNLKRRLSPALSGRRDWGLGNGQAVGLPASSSICSLRTFLAADLRGRAVFFCPVETERHAEARGRGGRGKVDAASRRVWGPSSFLLPVEKRGSRGDHWPLSFVWPPQMSISTPWCDTWRGMRWRRTGQEKGGITYFTCPACQYQ